MTTLVWWYDCLTICLKTIYCGSVSARFKCWSSFNIIVRLIIIMLVWLGSYLANKLSESIFIDQLNQLLRVFFNPLCPGTIFKSSTCYVLIKTSSSDKSWSKEGLSYHSSSCCLQLYSWPPECWELHRNIDICNLQKVNFLLICFYRYFVFQSKQLKKILLWAKRLDDSQSHRTWWQ